MFFRKSTDARASTLSIAPDSYHFLKNLKSIISQLFHGSFCSVLDTAKDCRHQEVMFVDSSVIRQTTCNMNRQRPTVLNKTNI